MWFRRSIAIMVFLGAQLLTLPEASSAQQYEYSAVALPGDIAPGTGGGTYNNPQFGRQNISASGDVVFQSFVAGGSVGIGLFLDSGGIDRAVALPGDVPPDALGATFTNLNFPAISPSGDVVFSANLSGGTGQAGLFKDSGGTLSTVIRRFDPAPATGGGQFNTFNCPSINSSGDVAFQADITGGTAGVSIAIFVRSGVTDRAIAFHGDIAPGTTSTLFQPSCPFLAENGDVAFRSLLFNGVSFDGTGVFVDSIGGLRAAALPGDAAPSTGGGTYSPIGNDPGIDAAGNVVFQSSVVGGSSGVTFGYFLDSNGTDTAVALEGQPIPAPIGGTFQLGSSIPMIGAGGDVVFQNVAAGSQTELLIATAGGAYRSAGQRGDVAPGTGGGTFSSFGGINYSINASTDVAFLGGVSGGTVGQGIFRATFVQAVPALDRGGLALVVGTLIGGAWLMHRRMASGDVS